MEIADGNNKQKIKEHDHREIQKYTNQITLKDCCSFALEKYNLWTNQ